MGLNADREPGDVDDVLCNPNVFGPNAPLEYGEEDSAPCYVVTDRVRRRATAIASFLPESWQPVSVGNPRVAVDFPHSSADDKTDPEPWHLEYIGLPGDETPVHDVTVAVLDGGLTNGCAFADRLWRDGQTGAHGADCSRTGTCQSLPAVAVLEHGDLMASIIAARRAGGAAGIAQNAKLMPINVVTDGTWTLAPVIKGLRWAHDHGAKIASLSLDSVFYDRTKPGDINGLTERERTALLAQASWFAGRIGLTFIAAGNEPPHVNVSKNFPSYDGVFAVAAHDTTGVLLPISGWGQRVSIAAPGERIVVPAPDGVGFKVSHSTSAATALVAGAVARAMNVQGELDSPREVWQRLLAGSAAEPLVQARVSDSRRLSFQPPPLESLRQWTKCPMGRPKIDEACPSGTVVSLRRASSTSFAVLPLPAGASAIRLWSTVRPMAPAVSCSSHLQADLVAAGSTVPGPAPSLDMDMADLNDVEDFLGPVVVERPRASLLLTDRYVEEGCLECVERCDVLVGKSSTSE